MKVERGDGVEEGTAGNEEGLNYHRARYYAVALADRSTRQWTMDLGFRTL